MRQSPEAAGRKPQPLDLIMMMNPVSMSRWQKRTLLLFNAKIILKGQINTKSSAVCTLPHKKYITEFKLSESIEVHSIKYPNFD